MANLTPNDLVAAVAAKLVAVEIIGLVATEARFAQNDAELARVIKGQVEDGVLRGCMIAFGGIVSQTLTGTCDVVVVYKLKLKFFLRYLNDSPGEKSSEAELNEMIFAANEALNADLYLGIESRQARHQFLVSSDDIGIDDMGSSAVSLLYHAAPFDLQIEVTNTY